MSEKNKVLVTLSWGKEWFCFCNSNCGSHFGLTNNKVLWYRTGNYIRYPVINHNGKEYEEECVCVTLSHSVWGSVWLYDPWRIYISVYICINIYNKILLSHWKEWNSAICSNMDGPRDYHTEWNKLDREWKIPCDITYMWNLKEWYKRF